MGKMKIWGTPLNVRKGAQKRVEFDPYTEGYWISPIPPAEALCDKVGLKSVAVDLNFI